ncbi:thiamine pyrophosphokinase [Mongoliitalea daihaiensis]|uniref:thiamine pyrophosphokinase n=1 Tax=Mongoliitalea daihaiensis TaxID=2782006 RepID=UPI001F2031E3|nr:thiamine pyrophosphokinase [Mongoliitalea daihaiensis]UJP66030.1 thiamine pyrophosphokinase [Mongoliitalea daihaiensis]
MSSHHFVKEQQEPALLILSTEGLSFEQVAPLLEWVPTVLVAQSEVDQVISWGIKIDLILAEMSYQQANFHLLEEQYPVKFVGVSQQDFLQEGLQYLIATKHGAVNIIGYPHSEVEYLLPFMEFLDIVIWDAPLRYFPIKSGQFKKWFSEGTQIQLHAPEGTFIEVKSPDSNELISIKHATIMELPEGSTAFKSNGLFWVGEFV